MRCNFAGISPLLCLLDLQIIKQMIVRQRLLAEMSSLVAESKWQQTLSETMNELFELKPMNSYLFTQRKASLKQKFDNSKTSQYLIELTVYLTYVDPLTTSEQIIRDRIISLCVQKYQHTKIKKTEILQIIAAVLHTFEGQKREHFAKLLEVRLDQQIYSILDYAELLYYAVVFRAILAELETLELKLSACDIALDRALLLQYLNTVNENNSILKKMGLELEGDSNVYKLVAEVVLGRMFN